MSTRVPASHCTNPECNKLLDGATHATGDERPEEGNISICFYCGHIMMFGENMILRDPTDAEMIEIAGIPELVKISAARGQYMKRFRQ